MTESEKQAFNAMRQALEFLIGCSVPMTRQQEECWPVMQASLTAAKEVQAAPAAPLSDAKARKLIMEHFGRDSMVFIRAIEAAHGIVAKEQQA